MAPEVAPVTNSSTAKAVPFQEVTTTAGFNGIYGYFTNTEVIAANTVGNGGSGASATANGSGAITGGDLERFSGDIIYVENRSPISRADDQIEDIKLIIEF